MQNDEGRACCQGQLDSVCLAETDAAHLVWHHDKSCGEICMGDIGNERRTLVNRQVSIGHIAHHDRNRAQLLGSRQLPSQMHADILDSAVSGRPQQAIAG